MTQERDAVITAARIVVYLQELQTRVNDDDLQRHIGWTIDAVWADAQPNDNSLLTLVEAAAFQVG